MTIKNLHRYCLKLYKFLVSVSFVNNSMACLMLDVESYPVAYGCESGAQYTEMSDINEY